MRTWHLILQSSSETRVALRSALLAAEGEEEGEGEDGGGNSGGGGAAPMMQVEVGGGGVPGGLDPTLLDLGLYPVMDPQALREHLWGSASGLLDGLVLDPEEYEEGEISALPHTFENLNLYVSPQGIPKVDDLNPVPHTDLVAPDLSRACTLLPSQPHCRSTHCPHTPPPPFAPHCPRTCLPPPPACRPPPPPLYPSMGPL